MTSAVGLPLPPKAGELNVFTATMVAPSGWLQDHKATLPPLPVAHADTATAASAAAPVRPYAPRMTGGMESLVRDADPSTNERYWTVVFLHEEDPWFRWTVFLLWHKETRCTYHQARDDALERARLVYGLPRRLMPRAMRTWKGHPWLEATLVLVSQSDVDAHRDVRDAATQAGQICTDFVTAI